MLSADGLVVRVRPREGRLSGAQAAAIAALSLRHGNGSMDLTSRANLQLRGVAPQSHGPLVAGLHALGLVDADAAAEARRNVIVTPFWTLGDGTCEIAAALADALASDGAPSLPGKFGFAVDTAGPATLRSASADVRIERGPAGFIVRADGCSVGAQVAEHAAVDAAMALARWFMASGGAARGRMAQEGLQQRLPPRFTQAGMPAPSAPPPRVGAATPGWLVGLEFGVLQAETLAALAVLGPLRLTPWRMVLVEGATHEPRLPGLITRPDDPLLRVVACRGAPACPQAAGATRPLARALAPHVAPGGLLHVSGCAKGCAHPGPARTLVATPDGFDFVQSGLASSPPDMRAVPPELVARLIKPAADAPPI